MKTKTPKSEITERVIVTNPFVGIFHMQVCVVADATDEEILAACNRENPSGTQNGWGEVIRDGEFKPVKCKDNPERLHILVSC